MAVRESATTTVQSLRQPVDAKAAIAGLVTADGIMASDWHIFKDAMFGRDTCEVAEDLLEIRPDIARLAIKSLGQLQGTDYNSVTEEAPGRIIHEYRSLLVNGRRIGPAQEQILHHLADKWGGSDSEVIYYGSVDATCLYARLIARFCATYGPQILEQQLLNLRSGQSKSVRQCLLDALDWITRTVQASDTGLLEFARSNPRGHAFQVWQDGATSYLHTDGNLPNLSQPMAEVAVQGLAYDALTLGAQLLRQSVSSDDIRLWQTTAERLQAQTLELFWMPETGFMSPLLDRHPTTGQLRQLEVLKASPAELLDTGLFDTLPLPQKQCLLQSILEQVLGPQFLTPVGIRTRSLAWKDLLPYADYQGSLVTWVKQTYDIARGCRRQGLPGLAKDLESRILNLVNITGSLVELAYVDPCGCANFDPQQLRQWVGETRVINGTNIPEHIQAWTASAVYAIQDDWRRRLEDQLRLNLTPAELLAGPEQWDRAYRQGSGFAIDTAAGLRAEHQFLAQQTGSY